MDCFDGEDLASLRAMRENLERDLTCYKMDEDSMNEKQDQLERKSESLCAQISNSLQKLKVVKENTTKCEGMNQGIDGHMEILPKQEMDASGITDNFTRNGSVRETYLTKIDECRAKKHELILNQETEVTRIIADAQTELDSLKEQEGKNNHGLMSKLKLIESQKHWLERDMEQIQVENEELTKICSDLIQTSP